MARSQASGGSTDRAARDGRALDLRRAGVDYDAIARQLDYRDRSDVRRAIERALRVRDDERELDDERSLEIERLDRLLSVVWAAALKGDAKAVDQALKISERRAKLLGLDTPTPSETKPRLVWEQE